MLPGQSPATDGVPDPFYPFVITSLFNKITAIDLSISPDFNIANSLTFVLDTITIFLILLPRRLFGRCGMKIEVEIDDNIYRIFMKYHGENFDIAQFLSYLITQTVVFTAKRDEELKRGSREELEKALTDDLNILQQNINMKFHQGKKEST